MKSFITQPAPAQGVAQPGDWIMHGDVILFCESALPDDFAMLAEIKDGTLAEGEATLHFHRLFDGEFELKECQKTKTKWLKVVEPCLLRHQEHKQITISPGHYRIGIQTEYDPFEKRSRQVVD